MGKSSYGNAGGGRRRRKVCRLCGDKIESVNYKDVELLRTFTTEMGKIIPRDRKSTRLNSSHIPLSRMPSSA